MCGARAGTDTPLLDDRRQATGRDSGECPKTVTHII